MPARARGESEKKINNKREIFIVDARAGGGVERKAICAIGKKRVLKKKM
jgi:hypothetical protein